MKLFDWFKPPSVQRPTQEQIKDKVDKINTGQDHASVAVAKQKQKYNNDLVKLQKQAKIVLKETEDFTVLAIAMITKNISIEEARELSKSGKL